MKVYIFNVSGNFNIIQTKNTPKSCDIQKHKISWSFSYRFWWKISTKINAGIRTSHFYREGKGGARLRQLQLPSFQLPHRSIGLAWLLSYSDHLCLCGSGFVFSRNMWSVMSHRSCFSAWFYRRKFCKQRWPLLWKFVKFLFPRRSKLILTRYVVEFVIIVISKLTFTIDFCLSIG